MKGYNRPKLLTTSALSVSPSHLSGPLTQKPLVLLCFDRQLAFQVSNWFPAPTREVADRPPNPHRLRDNGRAVTYLSTSPPAPRHKHPKPKILSAAGPPSPPPCVPRRPGTPSNHRHAPPLLVRRRHRLSIPKVWQLSVVDAVLPPLQHRRHQRWQLSLRHRHGPPPPAATRRRPSNHKKPPTRLHRCISASSMPPALDPGVPAGRVGGASVGQAPTSMQQHSTAQPGSTRRPGPRLRGRVPRRVYFDDKSTITSHRPPSKQICNMTSPR